MFEFIVIIGKIKFLFTRLSNNCYKFAHIVKLIEFFELIDSDLSKYL